MNTATDAKATDNVTATTENTEADFSDESLASSVRPPRGRTSITVSFRRSVVLVSLALATLVATSVVFACLYFASRATIADRDASAANDERAETIASDYAVGASTVDYHDVNSWLNRLKANTNAQLAAKFDATAPQLEQILAPLQWISKATPLSATVTSESSGIYKVNAYLTVSSTSAQNPDGAQSTVTYSLTIDSNSDWKITDVGGLQNALPAK